MKKEFPNTETILRLLAGGAVLTTFILNPQAAFGLASAMGMALKMSKDWQSFPKSQLKRTVDRLRKRKLVKLVEKNNQTIVELTEFGKKEILRFDVNRMKIDKPKKWDGKWWMVIFDIPEKAKRQRNIFQRKLKALDFYFIQKSVCIHPFNCQKEIEALREVYNIKSGVDLIRVDTFEKEYLARTKFNL